MISIPNQLFSLAYATKVGYVIVPKAIVNSPDLTHSRHLLRQINPPSCLNTVGIQNVRRRNTIPLNIHRISPEGHRSAEGVYLQVKQTVLFNQP